MSMSPTWRFEPKRRSHKSRDPMQASFFTNESIDDDTHALVRESIQNSLDEKADRSSPEPVFVRFFIGSHSAESGVMARYISDYAWLHFNAEDNGLVAPPLATDNCKYLVYEDFNTKGLVGDELSTEEEPGNSFYFFMRAEGQSGKQEGQRGRHGIGKFVFPYTSGIRMFIVATVRSSDGRCLIAGQSVLKSHHVDGERFTPDGWWGGFEKDGADDFFQMPVDDPVLFKQLVDDFCLAREENQSGLSLIMPYIQEELTADRLSEHVIREYFWPILSGQLVVEVTEAGQSYLIDNTSIHCKIDEWLNCTQLGQITPYTTLAYRVLTKGDYPIVELNLPKNPSFPKWDQNYLCKEVATKIHQELKKTDSIICIRCPLYVQLKNQTDAITSHFDIYLASDDDDAIRKPLFVREGIVIPEDRVPKIRGYTSIVVIESGAVATMLGDSENPAHTEWEKNAPKFKGKYTWGSKTIDFIRHSVKNLINLISQGDEEEDVAILSDIFYLDLPENDDEVPASRKRKKKENPEPDIPIPSKPRTYRLQRIEDGFIVQGPLMPLRVKRKYQVKVAYDFAGASKATALKKWTQDDFDIGGAKYVNKPEVVNMSNVSIGGNIIEFEAESSDFKLVVQGFDCRRDIIVDVTSEVITDEEV